MRRRLSVRISCQCPPLTRACALSLPPIPCRLGYNDIGDEGASALALVLNETEITHLKCAAAPECSLSCQCPLTLLSLTISALLLARSLRGNNIRAEGATALAAILKETQITNLECAASVCFYVNAR